jgi:hypothetical protein
MPMPLVAEHTALRALCGPTQPAEPSPRHEAQVTAPAQSVLPPLGGPLSGRRSARDFADRPVPAELLAVACHAALEVERACWPVSEHGDAGLGIAAAITDVTGLAGGLYRYLPDRRQFSVIAGVEVLDDLRSAYAAAPSLLLVHGDLDMARDASPSGGYQRLLVRAGALGYAALLAALSAGLCGCPYGGASASLSSLLRTGHGRPHHLFTVSLGWPTADDHSPEP